MHFYGANTSTRDGPFRKELWVSSQQNVLLVFVFRYTVSRRFGHGIGLLSTILWVLLPASIAGYKQQSMHAKWHDIVRNCCQYYRSFCPFWGRALPSPCLLYFVSGGGWPALVGALLANYGTELVGRPWAVTLPLCGEPVTQDCSGCSENWGRFWWAVLLPL
eukprot:5539805-Amphidinium_carterae.1